MIDFVINHWEQILDAAAKVATIIAAIGLWVAYRQYKHSVELAHTNERRAAIELATRECANYGTDILKRLIDLVKEAEESWGEYFIHCKLVKDEQQLRLDVSAVTDLDQEKIKPLLPKAINVLNSLEAFAIPFVRNVADCEVGFTECGRSYVGIFEKIFPLYGSTNLQHYYKSSQALYWRWQKRFEQEEREHRHAAVTKEFVLATEMEIRARSNSWAARFLADSLRYLANKVENK